MPATPTDPHAGPTEYARMSSELFRTWEKAMGAWWDQVLETPSFLGSVNQNLGQTAKARGQWTQAVDAAMEQAHLPTRGDVVRTLRVVTLLEERLLAQEDLLLELKDRADRAEKEALEARIEAAEARIETRARLDQLLARVESLASAGGQTTSAAASPAVAAPASPSTDPAAAPPTAETTEAARSRKPRGA